jgi:hypothetical protein
MLFPVNTPYTFGKCWQPDCDNTLLIREGTKVKASVTVAEKRGMLGKAGKVDF